MFNNYITSERSNIYESIQNAIFNEIEKKFSDVEQSVENNTFATNKIINDINNINSKIDKNNSKYDADLNYLSDELNELGQKITLWIKQMSEMSDDVGKLSESINKVNISTDILDNLKKITNTDNTETIDNILIAIIKGITVLNTNVSALQSQLRMDVGLNINANKLVIYEIESLKNTHKKIINQLNECKQALVSDAISDINFHSSFIAAIDNELCQTIKDMIDDINKDINNNPNTYIGDKLNNIDKIRDIIKSYIVDKIKYVQTMPDIVNKLTIDINSKIQDIQSENNKLSKHVNKNSEIINDLKSNLNNITLSHTELKSDYKNYFDKNMLSSIINQYKHTRSDISTLQENVNKLLLKYSADTINTNTTYPVAAGYILSLSPIYSILTYEDLEAIYVPKDLFYSPIHFGKYSSYMYAFELPKNDMEIDMCDLSKITKSIGIFPKYSLISSRPHVTQLTNVASKLLEYYDYCIKFFYIRNILADLYSRGDVSGILYWTNQRFLYNNQFISSLINNLDMFDFI